MDDKPSRRRFRALGDVQDGTTLTRLERWERPRAPDKVDFRSHRSWHHVQDNKSRAYARVQSRPPALRHDAKQVISRAPYPEHELVAVRLKADLARCAFPEPSLEQELRRHGLPFVGHTAMQRSLILQEHSAMPEPKPHLPEPESDEGRQKRIDEYMRAGFLLADLSSIDVGRMRGEARWREIDPTGLPSVVAERLRVARAEEDLLRDELRQAADGGVASLNLSERDLMRLPEELGTIATLTALSMERNRLVLVSECLLCCPLDLCLLASSHGL